MPFLCWPRSQLRGCSSPQLKAPMDQYLVAEVLGRHPHVNAQLGLEDRPKRISSLVRLSAVPVLGVLQGACGEGLLLVCIKFNFVTKRPAKFWCIRTAGVSIRREGYQSHLTEYKLEQQFYFRYYHVMVPDRPRLWSPSVLNSYRKGQGADLHSQRMDEATEVLTGDTGRLGLLPSKRQSCVQCRPQVRGLFFSSFLSSDPLLSLWRDFLLRLWEAGCRWGPGVGWVFLHFWAARGNFWSSAKPRVGWRRPVAPG